MKVNLLDSMSSSSNSLRNELADDNGAEEEEEEEAAFFRNLSNVNKSHLHAPNVQEPANHRPMSIMQSIMLQPKNLVKIQRRRTYLKEIAKRWVALLFSPRTVLVQLLACLCIFLVTKIDEGKHFKHIGTSLDLRIITMMLTFCVVFGINQSFARRERTLQDIAGFKSSITMLYYTMGDLDGTDKEQIFHLCAALLRNLTNYIYDRNELLDNKLNSYQQIVAIKNFYSDINKLLKIVKKQKSQVGTRLMPFLCKKINATLGEFERICATKDHMTPIGIRAFTNFFIWLLAILLAPYFVWHSGEKVNDFAAYLWAWTYFLMLGFLVDVKDILNDCFDNDSLHDDIVLDVDDILHRIKYGASH